MVSRLAAGLGRMTDLVLTEGRGMWVRTADGRRLLDCSSGIGALSTGHSHPAVVEAVVAQAKRITHCQSAIALHQPLLTLVDKLAAIMPHKSLDSFFFATTGAEAVENAVKLARMATGRANVIVMESGYHGRTYGAMSLTRSKTIYFGGFGPLLSNIYVTPFPMCTRCRIPHGSGDCCEEPIYQLRRLLKQQTRPQDTCAVLIEPILGEGGYYPAPASYMRQLREICDEHGMMLIADEVQTGFGRTGQMFAVEDSGVRPDIMILAKGLASGYPLAGLATNKANFDKQPPGSMGGTYSANVVACAAACATLDVIAQEGLVANAEARGRQLMSALNGLRATGKYPIIDIRGRGLMVGIEFDGKYAGIASQVSKACIEQDMLLMTTSAYEVIRFIPPLIMSAEDVDDAVGRLQRALDSVMSKVKPIKP